MAEFLQRPEFLAEEAATRRGLRFRPDFSGEQFKKRTFAGTVRAEDRHALAMDEAEGEILQGERVTAPDSGVGDFKDRMGSARHLDVI